MRDATASNPLQPFEEGSKPLEMAQNCCEVQNALILWAANSEFQNKASRVLYHKAILFDKRHPVVRDMHQSGNQRRIRRI